MREGGREGGREGVCVSVCVCMSECMSECEKERKREREGLPELPYWPPGDWLTGVAAPNLLLSKKGESWP